MSLNSYLKHLVVSKNVLPPVNSTMDPFMEKLRAIEITLVPLQEQVIFLAKVGLLKVALAQKTVTAGSRLPRTPKSVLDSLKESMKDISSMNDYPLVGWPQLPDLPKGDRTMTIKLRSTICENKKRDYKDTTANAKQNRGRLFDDRQDLNASTFSVSSVRKVQAQSPQIEDVIKAVINIENAFVKYEAKLDSAIVEVNRMSKDLLTTIPFPATTSSDCYSAQILNNSAGNYKKVICIFATSSMDYPQATVACQAKGMQLFNVATAEDYNQLIAFAFKVFPGGNALKLGGTLENGIWNVYTPDKTPLYKDAIPLDIDGPCLTYFTTAIPSKTKGEPCSTPSWSFCEYV